MTSERETNEQAIREGWEVFQVDDCNGVSLEIQRIDCPSEHEWGLVMKDGEHLHDATVFADDDKALEFVIHHARLGSQYHTNALALHCSATKTFERNGADDC